MNRYLVSTATESGKCPESRIQNSHPYSGFWKDQNQINRLRQNTESELVSGRNERGFWKSLCKFSALEQNPESGFSSLKGRCHPLKPGVAPNPGPTWWDDG